MTPHYADATTTVYAGDCLDVLRTLPDASVDAVVTDPPYGLGFMGKEWDSIKQEASRPPSADVIDAKFRNVFPRTGKGPAATSFDGHAFQAWCLEWTAECLRVLKPGGHLLAFGGTRTWHRLACAVEDAGFEVRDSIAWLYGSGFPKSLDVSKAIDKARDDKADVLRITSRLADLAASAGITRNDVDAHMQTSDMGGWWLSRLPHRCACPSVENWNRLRDYIPGASELDAEVWRLNGRKGSPGEAWASADVLREESRFNEASGIVNVGQGERMAITRQIKAPATDAAREWQGWGTAMKPAHEPVVWARKPFNAVPLGSEANRLHHLIGALLWLSLSPAKRAELDSLSSQAGQPKAWCASALAGAATSTSPDESAATATFNSPALASTLSNIVSSWSAILGALSDPTRTSTISTRSSTTTDLRTLSSLLAPLTSPTTMPRCECLLHGPLSPASSVASSSSADWSNWLHTLSASVPATAIEGIALVAGSALASVAESLSSDRVAESSVERSATTPSATSTASGTGERTAGSSPAFEPIVVARKPLVGTVAQNVLMHGTGALNVDGCRVGDGADKDDARWYEWQRGGSVLEESGGMHTPGRVAPRPASPAGRWPANVVLDESQAAALDQMSGETGGGVARSATRERNKGWCNSSPGEGVEALDNYGDTGGASRFMYVAKADATERPRVNGIAHATVKPLALMRWLVRLVTPPGGTILEPFAGSGTTVEAAILEGFRCIAVERETDYLPLILQRIHRRRDPVQAVKGAGEDGGLFDLIGGELA